MSCRGRVIVGGGVTLAVMPAYDDVGVPVAPVIELALIAGLREAASPLDEFTGAVT